MPDDPFKLFVSDFYLKPSEAPEADNTEERVEEFAGNGSNNPETVDFYFKAIDRLGPLMVYLCELKQNSNKKY